MPTEDLTGALTPNASVRHGAPGAVTRCATVRRPGAPAARARCPSVDHRKAARRTGGKCDRAPVTFPRRHAARARVEGDIARARSGRAPGPGPQGRRLCAGTSVHPAGVHRESAGVWWCNNLQGFDVASFKFRRCILFCNAHLCAVVTEDGERGGPRVQPSKQTTRCKAGYRATAQPPYSGCGRWGCAMRGVCVRMGAAVGTERSATPVTASTRSCDVCMSTVSCMHAHMCACMRPT